MKYSTIHQLQKIIDAQSEAIMPLLDDSSLGRVLDELHAKFYKEFEEALDIASNIKFNFNNQE